MASKYGKIAHGLIKTISKRVIASTVEQLEGFKEIEHKIKRQTVNIEEGSELKDYLDGPVTIEIQKMRAEVNRNAEVYILLQDYMFKFQPQEIQNRWAVYKKPRDLYDMVKERLDIIEKEKRRYEQEMLEEQ